MRPCKILHWKRRGPGPGVTQEPSTQETRDSQQAGSRSAGVTQTAQRDDDRGLRRAAAATAQRAEKALRSSLRPGRQHAPPTTECPTEDVILVTTQVSRRNSVFGVSRLPKSL